MPAEDEFEHLMGEAEAAAWTSSHAFVSRLQRSAWFSARKAVKKSPGLVIKFVVGKVPIVGFALSFAAGKITDKIRNKRQRANIFKHEGEPVSAVGAKVMSKSLSELAASIDKNITKQQAAYRELESALNKLDGFNRSGSPTTATAWVDGFKAAAYAYYRVDHYNVKIAGLVEVAEVRLEKVEEWAEKGTDLLIEGKENLWKALEASFESMIDEHSALLGSGRGRSSSS